MRSHQKLINSMVTNGILHTPMIIRAFEHVDRKYFVPEEMEALAYEDIPLSIGEGQTISQPSTVAFMLELLRPEEDQSILDIGSGSGWTTALLCMISGEKGRVTGVERVEKLVRTGQENLRHFSTGRHCRIIQAGKALGLPGEKFDRILVSASSEEIPSSLFEQLGERGVLVIPIGNTIYRFSKDSKGDILEEAYPGFRFVPLIY